MSIKVSSWSKMLRFETEEVLSPESQWQIPSQYGC